MFAGGGSSSGDSVAATSASLNGPYAVKLDSSDNVYIADTNNHRIRVVSAATGLISTIAGTGTASYSGDNGPATSATLNYPYDIAIDSSGSYICAAFCVPRLILHILHRQRVHR